MLSLLSLLLLLPLLLLLHLALMPSAGGDNCSREVSNCGQLACLVAQSCAPPPPPLIAINKSLSGQTVAAGGFRAKSGQIPAEYSAPIRPRRDSRRLDRMGAKRSSERTNGRTDGRTNGRLGASCRERMAAALMRLVASLLGWRGISAI